jgi:hypothetical protein
VYPDSNEPNRALPASGKANCDTIPTSESSDAQAFKLDVVPLGLVGFRARE